MTDSGSRGVSHRAQYHGSTTPNIRAYGHKGEGASVGEKTLIAPQRRRERSVRRSTASSTVVFNCRSLPSILSFYFIRLENHIDENMRSLPCGSFLPSGLGETLLSRKNVQASPLFEAASFKANRCSGQNRAFSLGRQESNIQQRVDQTFCSGFHSCGSNKLCSRKPAMIDVELSKLTQNPSYHPQRNLTQCPVCHRGFQTQGCSVSNYSDTRFSCCLPVWWE